MSAEHVFDRALALEAVDAGERAARFRADLDRELWVADSGPWGGYVAALLTAAIGRAVPELDLMSLTVHFARRLQAGPAEVILEIDARGSRVGHLSACIEQDGRAGATALATVGRNPQPDFISDFPLPAAPPPDDVQRRSESSHAYMQHFDVRPTVVVRPWSGESEGTLAGWVRLVEPRPVDLPLVAALSDVWMPGTWARLTEPHRKVTVDMTTHFRSAVEGTPEWCFVRIRTRHVERGFADEECEVWGSDGRLLTQSRQLVLLARRA